MVCMLTDFNKMQHVYVAMKVLYHLLGVIADMQEVKEVSVRTQLAHDLHHTYALPQAAGWSCPCKKRVKLVDNSRPCPSASSEQLCRISKTFHATTWVAIA